MKEQPTEDFSLAIRDVALDHLHLGADVASLFAGIFEVTCNHVVTVTFIPEYRTKDVADVANWDAPASSIEARWCTAMSSSIVVTPGSAELVERRDERSVFLVEPLSFAAWDRELRALLEEIAASAWLPFGAGGVPVSTIGDREVVRFLRREVLCSPHVSAYGLKMLCLAV